LTTKISECGVPLVGGNRPPFREGVTVYLY
jgi:hypothetical protein